MLMLGPTFPRLNWVHDQPPVHQRGGVGGGQPQAGDGPEVLPAGHEAVSAARVEGVIQHLGFKLTRDRQ